MFWSLWPNDSVFLRNWLFSETTCALEFHQLLWRKFQLFLKKHLCRLCSYCILLLLRLNWCWHILADTAHALFARTHVLLSTWLIHAKSLVCSLGVGSLLLVHLVYFITELKLSKYIFMMLHWNLISSKLKPIAKLIILRELKCKSNKILVSLICLAVRMCMV